MTAVWEVRPWSPPDWRARIEAKRAINRRFREVEEAAKASQKTTVVRVAPRPVQAVRVCPCGVEFTGGPANRVYCSTGCRKRKGEPPRRAIPPRTGVCPGCGDPLPDGAGPSQRYCSTRCRKRSSRARRQGAGS